MADPDGAREYMINRYLDSITAYAVTIVGEDVPSLSRATTPVPEQVVNLDHDSFGNGYNRYQDLGHEIVGRFVARWLLVLEPSNMSAEVRHRRRWIRWPPSAEEQAWKK